MAKAAEKKTTVLLGDSDGVNVVQTKDAFQVAFTPDRQLAKSMRDVPGAVLDREAGIYTVPFSSDKELANAVAEMRAEYLAIAADLQSIHELAKTSAIAAQKENETAFGVTPMISTYRKVDDQYRGEILNANGRFAAQFTHFGSKDGAAFVTIHRIADLDKAPMKGDMVGIKYDDKFRGSVTDISKTKSAAQLAEEFEKNKGVEVDGVTVTERGDKIGVAFDMNPVLMARIKRIAGAEFHPQDKVWEVPVGAKDFALRAAEDMRQEVVASTKEVDMLRGVAEQKVDGARVSPAFTKDGQEHFGEVIAVSDRFVLQKGGMANFKLHHRASLDNKSPERGSNISVKYSKGIGAVVDTEKKREQDKAMGQGR